MIDIDPNGTGLPGIEQLRIIVGAVMTVGLILSVLALIVSAIYEGFDWRLATVAGVGLAVAGNVLALWNPRPRSAGTTALQSRA